MISALDLIDYQSFDALDNQTITSTGSTSELATPWYSDQILPFDITLVGANEYGAMCSARIFGIELLTEGTGVSIDDAVTEMQATFVARAAEPMAASASPFQTRSLRPVTNINLARGQETEAVNEMAQVLGAKLRVMTVARHSPIESFTGKLQAEGLLHRLLT